MNRYEPHPLGMSGPRSSALTPEAPVRPVVPVWAAGVAIVLALLGLGWMVRLEATLPGVRDPGAAAAPGSRAAVIQPGEHQILEVASERQGDWFEQRLVSSTSLASDTPGASISLRFYGTSVRIIARVGPEAGDVYVQIDGQPVPHLTSDERGTYVSLWASQAEDEAVEVASGLSHDVHELTLTTGPTGQFAISGVEIVSQTPVPWAFALIYTLLALVLFLTVRGLGQRAARRLGWLQEVPRGGSEPPERR